MDQVSIKYTIIFYCKTLQNFTQIRIFGLKTNHLATMSSNRRIGSRFGEGPFLDRRD
jgi:hypothetical protein